MAVVGADLVGPGHRPAAGHPRLSAAPRNRGTGEGRRHLPHLDSAVHVALVGLLGVVLALSWLVVSRLLLIGGAAVLVFRSNIPAIAEFTFKYVDPDFVARARAAGRSIIVAGETYGQGSSRETAATAPMHLGVRAVIARSFARIHRANLINWGIVPLVFDDPAAWDGIERDDRLALDGLRSALAAGARVPVVNTRSGARFITSCVMTPRERDILLAGGILAHTRSRRT